MKQMHVNQEAREALSAGVDGELSPHELRFLLRRMDHDVELQRAWSRYHVIREGLRGRMPPLASPGFAARMQEAIARETLPARARRSHWLRWSAGGAIAASVAAATLMIGQPSNDAEPVMAAQSVPQDISAPVAQVAPQRMATMPSVVPPWLSGGAAGALSQPASATFGAPFTEVSVRQGQGMQSASYAPPLVIRQRTLDNHNGTYLLLLDPARNTVTHGGAAAQ